MCHKLSIALLVLSLNGPSSVFSESIANGPAPGNAPNVQQRIQSGFDFKVAVDSVFLNVSVHELGYNSSNRAHDGKWRKIEVELENTPAAIVRTRKGYYARMEPCQ